MYSSSFWLKSNRIHEGSLELQFSKLQKNTRINWAVKGSWFGRNIHYSLFLLLNQGSAHFEDKDFTDNSLLQLENVVMGVCIQ